MDALTRLQAWYASHCDGEWEHTYGVTIQTMDNPGWSVIINLVGTRAEGVPIPTFTSPNYMENDEDWVECRLSEDGKEYWGVGDENKLTFIIDYFFCHVS